MCIKQATVIRADEQGPNGKTLYIFRQVRTPLRLSSAKLDMWNVKNSVKYGVNDPHY
jgi:hypothetical protein